MRATTIKLEKSFQEKKKERLAETELQGNAYNICSELLPCEVQRVKCPRVAAQ